jgi:hypothetical protein
MQNVKSVELITHFDTPDPETGEKVPVLSPHFKVTFTDDTEELRVPFDPLNRHYFELSEWYADQKKKPFKFDFKNHKPE